MPNLGGMSPYPRRLGGGRPRVHDILDSLNEARGTAYRQATEDSNSTVYAENMALAYALAATWGTNERLSKLWNADSMPDAVVGRWEKILAIAPLASDTMADRRARIRTIFEQFGQASIHSTLYTQLEETLGDAFVAIEYIDIADAFVQVPDGTYPWGSVGTNPWSSTVAHILVRLQKPTGWTEGQFYEAAGQVGPILEPALPVWTTFSWYRPGATSTAVGGISAAGFYLDTASNLNNQILAS